MLEKKIQFFFGSDNLGIYDPSIFIMHHLKMIISNLNRVRTDLEKSLNLTLVLENSWILRKVSFVLELSWKFVKLSLKIE